MDLLSSFIQIYLCRDNYKVINTWTDREIDKWTRTPYVVAVHVDGWDYVSELRPPTGLLFTSRWYMSMEPWWHDAGDLGEKPVPVPLCPPQIAHGLTRAQTWTFMVRYRQLTTWTMAQPRTLHETLIFHFA
jgi:hypothetical protein